MNLTPYNPNRDPRRGSEWREPVRHPMDEPDKHTWHDWKGQTTEEFMKQRREFHGLTRDMGYDDEEGHDPSGLILWIVIAIGFGAIAALGIVAGILLH